MVEIERQRNQRHPFSLGRRPESREFALSDQQLPLPPFVVLEGFRLVVGRDVAVDQPKLGIFYGSVAFRDVRLAAPKRLDLGTFKHNPALDLILDRVVIAGAPVASDNFVIAFFF